MKDLADRMKKYESVTKSRLIDNLPAILRIDGRAFHSLCTSSRGFERPFDDEVISMMNEVAIRMCNEVQGVRLAYIQSDEISFLLYTPWPSQSWFGGNIQKIVSIAAAYASATATWYCTRNHARMWKLPIQFDARTFQIPNADETLNYFYWRQKDWERNSVSMLAQSLYSHRELLGKNKATLHDMIHDKGQNWADLPTHLKNGRCIKKFKELDRSQSWLLDNEIPIFTQERDYILNTICA